MNSTELNHIPSGHVTLFSTQSMLISAIFLVTVLYMTAEKSMRSKFLEPKLIRLCSRRVLHQRKCVQNSIINNEYTILIKYRPPTV